MSATPHRPRPRADDGAVGTRAAEIRGLQGATPTFRPWGNGPRGRGVVRRDRSGVVLGVDRGGRRRRIGADPFLGTCPHGCPDRRVGRGPAGAVVRGGGRCAPDRAQRHRPAAGRTAHRPGLQRLRGGRAHLQPGHVRRSGVPGDDLGAPFRVGRRPRGGPEPGADPVHRGVPAPGPGRAVRAAVPDRLQEGGYRSAAPRLPVPGPAAGVDPRTRPGRLPPVGRAATDTVRTATR